MKPSKPALLGLLIDVSGRPSAKLFELLEQLGIALVTHHSSDGDLYHAIQKLKPDIVFVDVNSNARDTLEHVLSSDDSRPQALINPDGELRTSLGRLAGEIGICLYATYSLSPLLVQALIDVTISHCHSIDTLKRELSLLRHNAGEDSEQQII